MDTDKELIIEKHKKNRALFLISGKEILLDTFFSVGSWRQLCEGFNQSKDYKEAFSLCCYWMYQRYADENDLTKCSEIDFVNAEDNELLVIMKKILVEASSLKEEFDLVDEEDRYKRFYIANENLAEKAFAPLREVMGQFNKKMADVIAIPAIEGLKETLENYKETIRPIKSPLFDFPEISRVLSGVPKISFDVNDLMAPIREQFGATQTEWKQLANSINSSFKPIFEKIDFSFLSYHREWNEQNDALLGFGWFFLDELPKEIIHNIFEQKDAISSEEVDTIICRYFRENRCTALKRMVAKWDRSPYFRPRKQIFHEALVHHSRRYYNSSVTMLTLHSEGVLTDYARINLTPRYQGCKAAKDIKTHLDTLPYSELSFSDWVVFSFVFEKIITFFTESFSASNPDVSSNESRHKIAHGHAIEKETEASSLKRFLYLNEVFKALSTLDNASADSGRNIY